jgi:spoIIIJ-associated protein
MSDLDDGPAVDEGAAASQFLAGLAEALGVDATTSIVAHGPDDLEVRLDGADLGLLIGPRGQTLSSVQELTRLAVQRNGERRGWLRIDIGGYREKRREALIRFTEQVVADVTTTATPRALEPMSSADRKIVHDAATSLGGVRTSSEGEDPHRRVVISPLGDA